MKFGLALSGLQEFLYDLSPQTQSREARISEGGRDRDAARRLRIRSAMLALIPGLVAWELKQTDPTAKVVYLGGGKLLARANHQAVEQLQPKMERLYDWLVERSGGALGAYWTTCDDSAPCSKSVQLLLARLNSQKWRAGRSGSAWHKRAGCIQPYCTGGFLGNKTWESEQGAAFAKNEDWIGFKLGQGHWHIGPWRAEPVTVSPDIALAGKATADVEVSIPTYTPKRVNGETIPLHELAELDEHGKERGGAYLALLKLDGDGIGKLMGEALAKDVDCAAYKEASGKLTEFFGAKLQGFLKKKYPRLYLVYSGGDDMVATGYFLDVLKAARDVQKEFVKAGLESTVSAGIAFYTRQSSILKAIEAAEQDLENAKRARNAISVAGCRLSWDELAKSLSEIEGLREAIAVETINPGALNLMRQLGEPWLPGAPEAEHDLRFRSIPQMHYMRTRRTGWKENEWPGQVRALFDSLQTDETDWPRASLVGTLAAWSTKKKMEDE